MKIGVYGHIFAGRKGREIYGILLQESQPILYIPKKEWVIEELLKKIKQDGVEVLFIYGGDGTLHLFLTYWFSLFGDELWPPILIPLHGGTMNVAATALGIPHNSVYAIRKIVELLREDREKYCHEVSLLKVLGSKLGNLYGLEVALGPAVNFLKEYEDGPKGVWQVVQDQSGFRALC